MPKAPMHKQHQLTGWEYYVGLTRQTGIMQSIPQS